MKNELVIKEANYSIYKNFIEDELIYLTASVENPPLNMESEVAEIYNRLLDTVINNELFIVHERLFGSISKKEEIINARKNVFKSRLVNADSPLTYIQGKPVWGEGLAGIQMRAVDKKNCSNNVDKVYYNGSACGHKWKQNGNTYLMLQDIHGSDSGKLTPERETEKMFAKANDILICEGASFKNVVRTWIYLSDILDWYDDFNRARTKKFNEFGLLAHSSNGREVEQIFMPASTGIMGNNPNGASGTMDVLAIIPGKGTDIKIMQSAGVSQKSPFRYKSAFSRAMTIRESNVDCILVSGTAAIDDKGNSLYPGDTRSQILKTIEVVENLLASENAEMKDITEATVFLKNADDYPVYLKVIKECGLLELPAVVTVADVCRHELLFELDATAGINRKSLQNKTG
jgi:enamine deaminase RidA (YjgF/YER057c/UK114 family)